MFMDLPLPPATSSRRLAAHATALEPVGNVPSSINAHMDARDVTVAEMERLIASDRRGTWMWAHAGGTGPELIRRLLMAHPNFHSELSGRAFDILGDAKWKVLLEDFPDRFILGTDPPNFQQFVLGIGRWRKVLTQLSPATANKLAHQNAARILSPGR